MKPEATSVEVNADDPEAYARLSAERQATLTGPEDDMWAAFADLAEPHSLTVDGRLVGRFAKDDEGQLHAFYVRDEFEPLTADLFARVLGELDVTAVITSTVDPTLLALALAAGGPARPTALMYDQIAASEVERPVAVRLARGSDHAAAVAFCRGEAGPAEASLGSYVTRRIELGELYLVEAAGTLVASGECRVDPRAPGNAHLGFVVGAEHRGRGLGSRLMHTLTEISLGQNLIPRCSTEPTNTAAQRAIRRAGFRTRHRVLRIAIANS